MNDLELTVSNMYIYVYIYLHIAILLEESLVLPL